MGQSSALVSRVMLVFIHTFSWNYSYLYFGLNTSKDTPLFNVLGWKVFRAFQIVRMRYKDMDNIMNHGYRASKRVGGWERDFFSR